jgi:radical SAM protein with 4Fe4S-binding SPASM domain
MFLHHEAEINTNYLHPNHLEEMKYFNENKVYCLQIESNLQCTQGCLYCYAASEDVPAKELRKEDIIKILDSAVALDIRAIDWLGGDPLLRDDWYELMKYAQENKLNNNIWTSGIPLANKDTARKALEVTEGGFISVHLDTMDEELYKKLHQGNPANKIQAIIQGVDNLIAFGKKPENMINCITFTKLVAGSDVERTIRFFSEEKGLRTCLTQMCITGLAEHHLEWVPSLQEIKEACEIRDKINYPDSDLSFSTMDTNKFYCGGIVCITIDGDVTPCSVIRKGYGNIHKSTLSEIIEKNREELLMTHIRTPENMPGNCSSCEHNAVCWGCRATAFYENGDILGQDPKCWKNQKA